MSQTDTTHSMGEKLRWWLAILVAVGAVLFSVVYAEQLATIFRALIVLGGLVLGLVIALTTEKGREFSRFVKQSNIERQKIVWPTKNETLHTTLIVLVVVVIFGLFLFLLDFAFSNLIEYFFG